MGAAESIWIKAASTHDLDPVVLYAVALQESRRMRPDGTVRPWPWTLRAPGYGALYFDSYIEAADKLVEIIESGVENVDIGMMQINWHSNGHLLPDPKLILKPEHNVQLAARILRRELDGQQGDLDNALARYHTPSAARGARYATSVLSILQNLRDTRGLYLALTL
ncbi:MAG: transglycosylase SLT domain-containing protein [Pseudomonadales bacterium]